MKALKIAVITCCLVFGLSQVQFARAGAWRDIKDTSKEVGQEVEKDSRKAAKTVKKAGKKTRKETKKAYRDGKKQIKEIFD